MKMPNSRQISEEQEDVYEEAPMDGSVIVIGPPGTGKTVIAFLRAQALSRRKKSPQVLMYNKVLQKYTENAGSEDDIPSNTLLSWAYSWWKAHEIKSFSDSADRVYLDCPFDEKEEAKALGARWDPSRKKWYVDGQTVRANTDEFSRWLDTVPPKLADYQYDWEAMLEAAAERGAMNDWGHLIIDEAQDFPNEMFHFLRYVARRVDNGGLTILADENQRLQEDNSNIEQIHKGLGIKLDDTSRSFKLTENFRNTQQIAELASTFYVGLSSGQPSLPKRQGNKPELIKAGSLVAQVEYIARILSNRAVGEVGVFTQNDSMRKRFYDLLRHRLQGQYDVQTYSSRDEVSHGAERLVFDRSGMLTVINRHSCKGLEFDMVFIPELQTMNIDGSDLDVFRMNMYVMCSRARESLYLLYTSTTENVLEVLQHVPNEQSGLLEFKNV